MAERHALVVGIDAYGNGIPPLGSARRDAEAVADRLAREHGYTVRSLLDSEATVAAVTRFLAEEIPPALSVESPFLVYFAGHGVAEGDDGTKGPQGYLILQDSELGKPESWLGMDALRKALDALPCRHLLVVLDCCYAGAFRWATATRDIGYVRRPLYKSQYDRYLEGEAWQALTSASADERAADALGGLANLRGANEEGHSPFAAALIEGLSGGADSSNADFGVDGVITATELYQYISTCLMPAADAPAQQTPGIWPLKPVNKGEFVFLNPKVQLKTEPDPPLDDANNPWRGLEAYSAANRDLFFGRQRVIDELLEAVDAGRFVVVVGASGAGKSSLVQAGLLPSLDAMEWAVVQSARLAGDPNTALDDARKELTAAPEGRRRLLVIDQFEELFTQCPDSKARARFLQGLRELIDSDGGPAILITVRSDFEGRAADDVALKDLWQAARYLVPPLNSEELRQVIEGPARVKAVYFEPAKVADDLFDEVNAMPGALPLLSFALAEMYRQAQLRRRADGTADRAMSREDYAAVGGVIGALNRRATKVYDDADDAEQATIRRIFLRLVTQEAAGLTRRRVERSELQFGDGEDEEQQRVDRMVQRFVDAGLLVVDGDFVEPAHDALVVEWQELHDWLKKSHSQDLIRAAWRASSDWNANDKASGYLWNRDPRLPQLAAARQKGELNAIEREFQTASTKRKRRQLRRLVATTAAVMVTLLAATVVALLQRNDAIRAKDSAASRALAAQATQALSTAPATALANSLEAVETSRTPQAERALRDALVSSRVRFVLPTGKPFVPGPYAGGAAVPVDATFSPDGSLLLTTGADGVARLWRTASGRPAAALEVPKHRIRQAMFGARGTLVLTTSDDSTARLWTTSTGREVARLRVPGARILAAAFGAHGPIVLTGAPNRPPELRDPRAPGRAVALEDRTKPPADAVFSPDGRLLLTFGGAGPARIYDARSGRKLAVLPTRPSTASFSRDGRFVVTLREDHVRVWRAGTGTPVATLEPAVAAVPSADGRLLLTVYEDGSAVVWQTAEAKRLAALSGFSNPPSAANGLTFTPTGALSTDGRLAATTDLDGVRVWDTTNGKLLASIAAGYASRVAFSPDGRQLASTTGNGAVVVSQAVPSAEIATGHGPPNANLCCMGFDPVLSPNRDLLVAATNNGAAAWRIDGSEAARLPAPWNTVVRSADFSADGSLVATNAFINVGLGSTVPVTTVWRTRDSTRVAVVPGQSTTVDLSPDGRFIVTDDDVLVGGDYETRRNVWLVSSVARIPPPPQPDASRQESAPPVDPWRRARARTRIPALEGTLAFDAKSRRAVVSGGRGRVRVVKVPEGTLITPLEGDMGSLDWAAFSPNGTRLVGRIGNGRLGLWDPATGRRVAVFDRPGESWTARFSGDGKLLLISASDWPSLRQPVARHRLSVRRASDGGLVKTLDAPGTAAFSSDGSFAAIPEPGGRLAIVDLLTGVTTDIQTGTAAGLRTAAFVQGSRQVVAWDDDGNVQVVACEICTGESALIKLARDRLARILDFKVPSPLLPPAGVGCSLSRRSATP